MLISQNNLGSIQYPHETGPRVVVYPTAAQTRANVISYCDSIKYHDFIWLPDIAQMEVTEERPPQEVESTQLTTIVSDQPIQATSDNSTYPHFYRNVDPFPDQGLREVLSRKYRIANVTWSGASAQDASLGIWNFPYALLQVATNLQDKINHFEYFRSDVEIEILVAGTKYLFGSLLCAVVPFFNGAIADPKTADVYTMSTLTHAILSPGSSTPIKLVIPYKSLVSYWRQDLNTDVGYFGSLAIRVLNPLRQVNDTAQPSCQISIFARFINPQVMGPTLHAQMSGKPPAKQGSGEQKAKSSSGIISRTLEKASTISSYLSVVPAVAPYASVASKAFNIGSQVAKVFGLDKPNSIETFKPVYVSTVNSLANGNGLNVGHSLAMDAENGVSNQPQDYGESEPECNINVLAQMPGLFKIGTFTTTDAAGTVVYKWHNSPSLSYATDDTAGTKKYYCDYTPCAAVANQYTFWNASMKYAIFFRCSMFQVAKVRISWHPTYGEILLTPEGEGDFASQVFDICGDTVITFEVPYCKNEPYAEVKPPWVTSSSEGFYSGALALSIVNPVTAIAGDVTMPIYYNVYCACGDNSDFQAPNTWINQIDAANTFTQIYMGTSTLSGTQVAQMDYKDNSCSPFELFKQPFPCLFDGGKIASFDKVCFGEQNTSILDLVHRFQRDRYRLEPHQELQYRKRFHFTKDVGSGLYPVHPLEFFRYWAWFSRGSTNHKLLLTSQTSENFSYLTKVLVGNAYYDIDLEQWQIGGLSGAAIEDFHFKPCLEFSLPYYSKYPYHTKDYTHPNYYRISFADQASTFNGFYYYMTSEAYDADPIVEYDHYIACGDDFTFGYFRGAPRVVATAAL